ncbi:histone H3.v1 isoform X2 [Eurytemora carolleeae]|uniref:histone H3.v1 isoform X2 n=1 Tax=Eurytemora carolleeae TaxID=1294199 RepID=UPI000C78410E|nr:histone H3.v1 isoform X2 [Eurytemora carolleeae]|eukprot:XP_023343586.1 histone H3.v1-like isoform X2 [Eurytemora affinis]
MIAFDSVSTVTAIKTKLTVTIEPEFQHVFEDGVYDWLSENRKSYMPELGGVLLAWDISKIKLKSPGLPPFKPEVIIKGEFTIFRPNPGERLWGRVLEVRPDLVICKTNEVLMVKVDTNLVTVNPGDSITYTFHRYQRDGKVGIIYGSDPRVEHSCSDPWNDSTVAKNPSSDQGTPGPSYRKSAITPNRAAAVTPNHATPNHATPNLTTPKPANPEETKTPIKPASTKKSEALTKKIPDSNKRKAESESAPSKKLKCSPAIQPPAFAAIQPPAAPANQPRASAAILPAASLQDTAAPELGPGWVRRYHRTAKSSWNTYISPSEFLDQITWNHDAAPAELSDDVPTKLDVITVTNTVISSWNRGLDNNLKNVQVVHGSAKSKPKPRKKATKPAQPLAEDITDEAVSMVEFKMEEETEDQDLEEQCQEEEFQEEEIEDQEKEEEIDHKEEQYKEEEIEIKEEPYQEQEIEEQGADEQDDGTGGYSRLLDKKLNSRKERKRAKRRTIIN